MKTSNAAWVRCSLVIVCAVVSVACASISGRKEILSVDTVPRGIPVEFPEAGDDFVAISPFFVEVSRSWNHEFKLQIDRARVERKVDCRFRWMPTLVGNAPLVLLTGVSAVPWVYGLGVGIDLATGAAWGCNPRILLSSPVSAAPAQRLPTDCDRLLFIAVDAGDPGTAWDYEVAWKKYRRKNSSVCEKILPHEFTDWVVGRYGLLQISSEDVREKLWDRALQLGYETGATHFLLVSSADDASSQAFNAEKIDAHRMTTVEKIDWTQTQSAKKSESEASLWRESRPFALRLVPNSLGISAGAVRLNSFGKAGEITSSDSTKGLIFTSVQHPDQYDPWALVFDWIPGGSLEYLNLSQDIVIDENRVGNESTAPKKPSVDAQAIEASGVFSGRLTGHTPMGAFSFDIGLGAIVLSTKRDAKSGWVTDASPDVVMGLTYRAFPDARAFWQVSFTSLRPLATLNLVGGHEVSTISTITLGLGYFFPEMPMWVGRKL